MAPTPVKAAPITVRLLFLCVGAWLGTVETASGPVTVEGATMLDAYYAALDAAKNSAAIQSRGA